MMRLALLVTAVLLCCGCAKQDSSPAIVCSKGGTTVKTGFTIDQFRATLQREHGGAVMTGDVLKSRSVEIHFRRLDDRSLLAEKVILVQTGKEMDPAQLFGLTP